MQTVIAEVSATRPTSFANASGVLTDLVCYLLHVSPAKGPCAVWRAAGLSVGVSRDKKLAKDGSVTVPSGSGPWALQ